MKKNIRKIFYTIALTFMTFMTFGQIPSYVNQNGLKGWWPFNGNSNNEINSLFNGNVNGAMLANDRDGFANSAYHFNGVNNWIEIGNIINVSQENAITISAWFNPEITNSTTNHYVGIDIGKKTSGNLSLRVRGENDREFQSLFGEGTNYGNQIESSISGGKYTYGNWYHLIAIYKNKSVQLYVNGILQTNNVFSNGALLSQIPNDAILNFGKSFTDYNFENFYLGTLDDIGIWNRELTKTEILNLYTSCNLITQNPESVFSTSNSSVQFNTNSDIQSIHYLWQVNVCNLGWMNLPENNTYQGAESNSLTISNISISNDNMKLRVIGYNDDCIDTSEVVIINILDTCRFTVYDTVTISTTDTLIINRDYLAVNNIQKSNIIKVYPNPTKDLININFNEGDYLNYSLSFINSIGQLVLESEVSEMINTFNIDQIGQTGSYTILFYDENHVLFETKHLIIN